MLTRRKFLKIGATTGMAMTLPVSLLNVPTIRTAARRRKAARFLTPDTVIDPITITKYTQPLIIPPAMPRTSLINNVHYYEIAVRQFTQQILPPSLPTTTVWGYGSAGNPDSFNYPSFTIEALYNEPVRVKWINDLKDPNTGNFLPHILPVDQTLHWANPPGGIMGRDMEGTDQNLYTGPVPIVSHLHGSHAFEDSDGFAEAWYLPAATNIAADYATVGSYYEHMRAKAEARYGVTWEPGSAVFQYPNDQRATTLWYHDHTLGMTRCNVYAGPAGFYLLRGGPSDQVNGTLPGPAPALGDAPGTRYYEIPIAIQDRTFNTDGSLFYPNNRAYFESLDPSQLQIPFAPDPACTGPSDIAPIWNPEFFGNTIVVNGRTWPYLDVEPRRYRLRFLNGCNSRFLILKFANNMPFWQIGAEGGFLPETTPLTTLLMAPAERADVIVDFSALAVGTNVILNNIGPDEPFGGGIPGDDFTVADPNTTGQVMQFNIVGLNGTDPSTPPDQLVLPSLTPLPPATLTRKLSLNELDSATVFYSEEGENIVLNCGSNTPFGPMEAVLGVVDANGAGIPLEWHDRITEKPRVGDTEIWEFHNFTADAHPIHIHEIQFEVVNRETFGGVITGPEPWETGRKDTVIAYPGAITRVKGFFDLPGLYVWHCHIVEHEDNEMMRPYVVIYPTTLPLVPKNS